MLCHLLVISSILFGGLQHSFSVEEFYQQVYGQLSASRGLPIESMVPALNVVIGGNCFLKGGPICRAPGGSVDPGTRDIFGKLKEWSGCCSL